MSLSVAAFLQRAEGLMLVRTGNHGRGVGLLEMRHMVEINCTSTNPLWEDCDQTGAQYAATEWQRVIADVRRVLSLGLELGGASSIDCFCSSAFLQFLSGVL